MKDDRLTEYNDDRLVCLKACKEWPHNTCGAECGSCGVNIQAKQRLAELEDKIENGTLAELPCKIGDTLYWASPTLKPIPIRVKQISYTVRGGRHSAYVWSDDGHGGVVGGNVFLSAEEAKHFYETAEAVDNG